MPDYESLYHLLFNAITDALDCIGQHSVGRAEALLRRAQQDAEDLYLSQAD